MGGKLQADLSREFADEKRLKPNKGTGLYDCVLGCSANPKKRSAFENIVDHGGLHTVCRKNSHYMAVNPHPTKMADVQLS